MPEVKMVPVESTNLAAAGYDEESNELFILFRTGQKYSYSGVKRQVYLDLLDAESAGEYFMANIRPVYAYKRIT